MHRRDRYARFLLAYRLETPDSPGAEAPGRGWVVRVPEVGEPAVTAAPALLWFQDLAGVGAVIEALLNEPRDNNGPALPDKRSERG